MAELTAERLRQLLRYDPDTGEWRWQVRGRGRPVNRSAGGIYPRGLDATPYRIVMVEGGYYRAARLAVLYMTGHWPKQVDHIDGDTTNDRWINLRECTTAQNAANRRLISVRNTSGFKGVSLINSFGKWSATIKINGKSRNLGSFDRKENAALAYNFAAYEAFGEFARYN